jgi:hypothetical protein
MTDILLTMDGDLNVNKWGDISLTESVRQAVKIRLQWFLSEWRLGPEYGIPYFQEILIKKPNLQRIRRIIRQHVRNVDEVIDTRNIKIDFSKQNRRAVVRLDIITSEGVFSEEVEIMG